MRWPVAALLASVLAALTGFLAPGLTAATGLTGAPVLHARPGGGPVAAIPGRAASGLTPQTYRERLQAAHDELATRGEGAAGNVAAALRAIGPVQASDGIALNPDLSAIIGLLESQPPDVSSAEARLRGLIGELSRALTEASTPAGSDPQGRLQRILERPEFNAQLRSDPLREWLAEKQRAALEFLANLLSPVARLLPGLDLRAPAVAAGLLLIAGVVFLIVRSVRRTMGPDVTLFPDEERDAALSAEAMREEAASLARAGAFREAVRALYLAVLVRWDERGEIRFDRALTNREVLTQVRASANDGAAGRLEPLVERFDRFWYGAVPCSAPDYADFAQLAESAWGAS